jgi:hypothetical protein
MFLKGTVPVGGKKDASPIGKPQRWQTEGKRDCVSTTLKNSHEPSLSTPFLPWSYRWRRGRRTTMNYSSRTSCICRRGVVLWRQVSSDRRFRKGFRNRRSSQGLRSPAVRYRCYARKYNQWVLVLLVNQVKARQLYRSDQAICLSLSIPYMLSPDPIYFSNSPIPCFPGNIAYPTPLATASSELTVQPLK